MKVRVHDTMGRSLITIQDIMENSDEADKKLAELKEAVSILSDSPTPPDGDIADEMRNCEKLGVRLILNGYLPKDSGLERIVISAIRECATNCVRHAHGTYIAVDIQARHGIYSVTITNDGEKPKGEIIEGGGLSGLRLLVERENGTMIIHSAPQFELIIELPQGETL